MSASPRHCARLLAPRGVSPVDHAIVRAAAQRLAAALRVALPPFGIAARVDGAPPRLVAARELAGGASELGRHTALAFAGQPGRALLSMDAAALMRLVDRQFGGAGRDGPPPSRLPGSARLLADRMLAPVLDALDGCWGEAAALRSAVAGREDELSALSWCAPDTSVLHLSFRVVEEGWPDWTVEMAFAADLVSACLERSDRQPAGKPAPVNRDRLDHVRLPLRAVVDEPRLPLGRVSALAVGDSIPLGVGGTATLRLAGRTVAHGIVGATNGKTAVRITAASAQLTLAAPQEILVP